MQKERFEELISSPVKKAVPLVDTRLLGDDGDDDDTGFKDLSKMVSIRSSLRY